MKELTKAEEHVLIAIMNLKDDAYGLMIKNSLKEATQREYVYGTLYSTLEQLVFKGYIKKKYGEPTPERGGKRKVLFLLTDVGLNALKQSFVTNQSVWQGITLETFGGFPSDE